MIRLFNRLHQPLTIVHNGTVLKILGQTATAPINSAGLTRYTRDLILLGHLDIVLS